MKANLGNIDRALRFIAGSVLMALAFTNTIGPWGWLGLILVATSFISFCPIYSLIGFSSRKNDGGQ